MVEQRQKDPGRRGRPKGRAGKTRHARPRPGRSSGAAGRRDRGRSRTARPKRQRTRQRRQPMAVRARRTTRRRTTRRRMTRPRRIRRSAREPVEVIPTDRWRPMRRVAGVAWEEQHHGEPRRVRTESAAREEAHQWPRHGEKGPLLEFEEEAGSGTASDEWEVVDGDQERPS